MREPADGSDELAAKALQQAKAQNTTLAAVLQDQRSSTARQEEKAQAQAVTLAAMLQDQRSSAARLEGTMSKVACNMPAMLECLRTIAAQQQTPDALAAQAPEQARAHVPTTAAEIVVAQCSTAELNTAQRGAQAS